VHGQLHLHGHAGHPRRLRQRLPEQAIGVLSTVALAPLAGSNGVGDLSRELAYARAHGLADLQVVNGTEPFTGRSSGRANGSPRQTSAIPAQVAMAQP